MLTTETDPESLEWCSFDDEYRKKLDRSPYVSLAREKRLAEAALSSQGAETVENEVESLLSAQKPDETTSSTSQSVPSAASMPEDADYEVDSDASNEDTEIPEGSLFDYDIPGVLKADEVAKLDLDHWKLLVRNMLVDFEVSYIDVCPSREQCKLTSVAGFEGMGRV